jgi:aspartate beta-hydroxylase
MGAAAGNPDNDRRIRALIAAARQNAGEGRLREAGQLLHQAEMESPRHPLVLNERALRMFDTGNLAGALALLEQAVSGEPSNPEIWFNLADTLRRLDRVDKALEALDRSLAIEPRNVAALLQKGSLQELRREPRAAAMSYRSALQAVPRGFKAPPWMDVQLKRAKEVVDANNRDLEAYIGEGLQDIRARFPDQQLRRFDQCVDTMLLKRGIYRQQPTFMQFPELPAIEFYDRDRFPWLDAIEAATDDIRAELLDVLSDGSDTLTPYLARPDGLSGGHELVNSRKWSVYSFWKEGVAFPEHIRRCPRTIAALENRPGWDVPGSGPTVMFSVLDAESRISPHTGPVNTRLTVHLPLIVPPGCGFRVGGQQREWHPGKAFVFDDSIQHEAWNDSDVPRTVLIFDIWSPFLEEPEREMVRALTARIGQYYGTMAHDGDAISGPSNRTD